MSRFVCLCILALCFTADLVSAKEYEADLVIYGGTSSGVAAAIQARRMGKTVVVVEPSQYLGGLTSSGLGATDSGNHGVIGGVSREFYQRVKKHYDQPSAWKQQKLRDSKRFRSGDDAMWIFEPHVALRIYRDWVKELEIPVVYGQRLDRSSAGVALTGSKPARVLLVRTESGDVFRGRMFIDATYEGDLLAAAGVSYTVGREANYQYNETLNGVQKAKCVSHQFVVEVDPYQTPGDPKSGLLHGIETRPSPADGENDRRIQAYCFRMCMTNVPENRVPFPKPSDYDEKKYKLLFRNYEAGDMRVPLSIIVMPNGKTDTNNLGAVSTDYIGQNYEYPEASYADREKICAAHRNYQMGLMWSLANHPRVPEKIREQVSRWGLSKDEFVENGHWPHQIYVREARRIVSDYVMSENDCRRRRKTPQSVGMGSYNMDSHNCMRYVTKEGHVRNEGDIQKSPGGPYQISYQSIVPARSEVSNLLSPVCVSSSHIAYGSIRMEPVFMILGQSAATAAVLAIDDKVAVQDVDYEKLSKRLLADGQVLENRKP